jgi:hypothetical protein
MNLIKIGRDRFKAALLFAVIESFQWGDKKFPTSLNLNTLIRIAALDTNL